MCVFECQWTKKRVSIAKNFSIFNFFSKKIKKNQKKFDLIYFLSYNTLHIK